MFDALSVIHLKLVLLVVRCARDARRREKVYVVPSHKTRAAAGCFRGAHVEVLRRYFFTMEVAVSRFKLLRQVSVDRCVFDRFLIV